MYHSLQQLNTAHSLASERARQARSAPDSRAARPRRRTTAIATTITALALALVALAVAASGASALPCQTCTPPPPPNQPGALLPITVNNNNGGVQTFSGGTNNWFDLGWTYQPQNVKPFTATAVVEGLIGGRLSATTPASCQAAGTVQSEYAGSTSVSFITSGVGSLTVNPANYVGGPVGVLSGTVACSGGVTVSGIYYHLTSTVTVSGNTGQIIQP
jgi:hypothetical protein